jgi:carboxymethylenebutenolidase
MKDRKSAGEYPQELWNLFDRFVHGDMDRRTFFEGAAKFAIGALTVDALWESIRPNYALANEVPPDDKRIIVEEITVASPQGNGSIRGKLARPAQGKVHPVVLNVHENRGLNPYIEDVGRRLAVAGFMSFSPDGLTSVGGYPGDDERGGELFKTVDPAKMKEDFRAAAHWLKYLPDSTNKLGVVGFCFGGGIANFLAVKMGYRLKAAVPFYGIQPTAEETSHIKAKLLIHDASLDDRILKGWPAYEIALKANNVKYTHYTYEGVNHGFHNDTTPRYDETAAKLAWSRTLEFFNRTLG